MSIRSRVGDGRRSETPRAPCGGYLRNGQSFAAGVDAWILATVMVLWPVIATADTQTIAADIAAQLDAHMLDAFAAEDPNVAGRFVATIFVGGHILAISAVHSAPAFVRQEIAAGHYREVYSILSTSAHQEGRLFVEDFGAPGLRLGRDTQASVDITWRDSTSEVIFDGNWRAQKLSETDYRERFAADEQEYAGMLRVLATELKRRTGA